MIGVGCHARMLRGKEGYHLECDKPLHREWVGQKGSFSVTYFLNDPISPKRANRLNVAISPINV